MSNARFERSQTTLSVSTDNSGATLTIEDLPPSAGTSIRFEVHALNGWMGMPEREKQAMRQVPHATFESLASKGKEEIVSYLKLVFDAIDWLKPGVLNPIDPARIHPTPPDGEQWSGYFVNLLVPKEGSEPSVSAYFLQRHKSDVPALSAEMLVSMISDVFRLATDPRAKAGLN